MNLKKKIFSKKNKTDFSLKLGSLKSAKDCGLYNFLVSDCCNKKK